MTAQLISPDLVEKLDLVASQIGDTPLHEITLAYQKEGVKIYAKLEWAQLGQSVKARPAFEIIKQAVLEGKLGNGQRLLDATSGNTGIGYASVAARLGIPTTIFMPENASPERKIILKALGAELVFTSPLEGTDGAQVEARALAEAEPDKYFYADQYNNDNNWKAHYYTTAREVYHQTGGQVTHLAVGLGTTGTFTGTGRKLKEINPGIQLVALHPDVGMHALEGWKDMETARVPGIYQPDMADQRFFVSTEEAYAHVKLMAEKEGMLISPSSAANLAGAIKLAETLEEGLIVTVFPDDASKYMEVIKTIFSE